MDIAKTRRIVRQILRRLQDGISCAREHAETILRQLVKGPSEGWATLILLLVSLMLAAWAVGGVLRVPGGFYSMMFWSVVLGLILAKLRFNGWLLGMSGLLIGVYLSFSRASSIAEGSTTLERYGDVYTRIVGWGQALVEGGISTDVLPFSFIILCLPWVVGFMSSWSLFRKRFIWGALLPSGAVIVTSLIVHTTTELGEKLVRLYPYLLVVVLLVARLYTVERRQEWRTRRVQSHPHDLAIPLSNALWLAVAVILITSLVPVGPGRFDTLAAVWDTVGRPVRVMRGEFERVFGGVRTTEPHQAHSFGHTSVFVGARTVGDKPILVVEAPFPIYLRAMSYDTYTSEGWMTSETQLVSRDWVPEQATEAGFQKLNAVGVRVTSLSSISGGNPLFMSGHPVRASVDYQLELLQPARFQMVVGAGWVSLSADDGNSAPDLQQTLQQLQALSSSLNKPLTESQIVSLLPEDVWMVSCEHTSEGVAEIDLERRLPVPPDLVSIRITEPLAAEQPYSATLFVSAATEEDLLGAGTDYPGWVLDRYLHLPNSVPSRVMDLAHELTEHASTPYAKALAIRDYLRTLEYSLDIQAPPYGTDGVDYFLFEIEEGYCQYFASAMAVLLRASGVPSRMVSGYGPGEMVEPTYWGEMHELDRDDITSGYRPDTQSGQRFFVIRDSHSWIEAFFPRYGWIPFEPTPAYGIVVRGDQSALPQWDAQSDTDTFPIQSDDISRLDPARGGIGAIPGEGESANAFTPSHIRLTALATVLAALFFAVWLVWRRLLAYANEPRMAYARTGLLATLSGLGPQENLTPYEYGHRLATAVPEVSGPLDTIVDVYVRDRYGRSGITDQDRIQIAEAWPQVRNHLLRHALRGLLPGRFR